VNPHGSGSATPGRGEEDSGAVALTEGVGSVWVEAWLRPGATELRRRRRETKAVATSATPIAVLTHDIKWALGTLTLGIRSL
jgi:hypothetical protein